MRFHLGSVLNPMLQLEKQRWTHQTLLFKSLIYNNEFNFGSFNFLEPK